MDSPREGVVERRCVSSLVTWYARCNSNAMASGNPSAPATSTRAPYCECCENNCNNCFAVVYNSQPQPVEIAHQQQIGQMTQGRAEMAYLQTETRGQTVQIQPKPTSTSIEKNQIHVKKRAPSPPPSAHQGNELAVGLDRSGFQTPDQLNEEGDK